MNPRCHRRAVLSGALLLGVTGCTRSPTPAPEWSDHFSAGY
jgi:hypothetical protein